MEYYTLIGEGRRFWKTGRQVSWAITLTCDIGFVLFGIEQGIIGNLIDGEDFLNTFGHPTGSYLGIIVSIFTLGCFFGCAINYFTGDIFGRRLTIVISMILAIIGVVLQFTAFSVPHFMIGRFIAGLSTGLVTSVIPMMQAEHARPEIRGNLVCSEALFVGVGLVYAYWLTYGLSFAGGAIAWRFPIATQVIFAVVILIMTLTIPESPRYLYMKGAKENAKINLAYVFGRKEDHPEIESLYQDIEESLMLEMKEGQFTWKRLFKKDTARTRQRVILAYMTMFAQQVGGINLVNYYITTVLINNVGLARNLAMILAGVSSICFTLGSLVPSLYGDKLGRRIPMTLGHASGGFSMMMISIMLSFQNREDLAAKTGAAAVAFFFIYQLTFGASVNCLPWVLIPELVPLQARARGTAIGVSANWLWNFVIVEITPVIIADIKWKSYLIFTFTNFAFAIMYFLFYPEIKQLSLESIDRLFAEKGQIFMGFVDTRDFRVTTNYDLESTVESAQLPTISKQEVEYIEKAEISSIVENNDSTGTEK